MIIKAKGLDWRVIMDKRNGVDVAILWCEEKGYTKEFYAELGKEPVIDLDGLGV